MTSKTKFVKHSTRALRRRDSLWNQAQSSLYCAKTTAHLSYAQRPKTSTVPRSSANHALQPQSLSSSGKSQHSSSSGAVQSRLNHDRDRGGDYAEREKVRLSEKERKRQRCGTVRCAAELRASHRAENRETVPPPPDNQDSLRQLRGGFEVLVRRVLRSMHRCGER
jgi:hypothetical protein